MFNDFFKPCVGIIVSTPWIIYYIGSIFCFAAGRKHPLGTLQNCGMSSAIFIKSPCRYKLGSGRNSDSVIFFPVAVLHFTCYGSGDMCAVIIIFFRIRKQFPVHIIYIISFCRLFFSQRIISSPLALYCGMIHICSRIYDSHGYTCSVHSEIFPNTVCAYIFYSPLDFTLTVKRCRLNYIFILGYYRFYSFYSPVFIYFFHVIPLCYLFYYFFIRLNMNGIDYIKAFKRFYCPVPFLLF